MIDEPDIRSWLAERGLERYADSFVQNDVDYNVLWQLDDSDLRELGVSLGHRRRLLGEIAALGNDNGRAPQPVPARRSSEDAERRHLTVMFCDLRDSTDLARKFDPEVLREVLRRYQNTVTSAVRRFNGYVARFVGDGVLAYFGWPRAYEDQAERAIRAGLEAAAAVARAKTPDGESLAARITIESGLVVVGDLIGDSTSDIDSVVGDTPNLAARLQLVTGPGEVVIGPGTRRLVGNTFELEELGEVRLKGFGDDVSAWVVHGEQGTGNRFEAVRGASLARLVGRTSELGLLREKWELARNGEGQAVMLVGEAGIGKSRLARDFRTSISRDLRFSLSYQCSPHYSNTAFYPIIQRIQRAVGFKPGEPVDRKLDKLEGSLRLWGSDVAQVAPLFANLMSIPTNDRYGPIDLTPQQIRQRTIEAMINQVLTLSSRRPVYFFIEDAHWGDPSMLDFVGELMTLTTERPIMVLVTSRPDDLPGWSAHANLTTISLGRLARRHATEIAQSIGGQELVDTMVNKIVKRSDGVPLYIEELTKSVVERLVSGTPLIDETLIPPSLQSSLVARLDRLDGAKGLAQIGAAIGREFSYELMASVAPIPPARIHEGLERLVAAGLVFRRGVHPRETYIFKHALVQDAAYDTMLNSRRKELHARIVDTLEARQEQSSCWDVDLLAHHSFRGEIWDKAFRYYQQAGQAAMDRAAVREAVRHFERALDAGTRLDESGETLRMAIDLRFDLRNALWSIGEFEQILLHLKSAEQLAVKLDDPVRTGWISVFESASLWQLGRTGEALSRARNSLAINEPIGDLTLRTGGLFYLGCATVTSGDCRGAEIIFQRISDALTGTLKYERCGLPFVPSVISRSWLVWLLAECGDFDRARVAGEEAMDIANTVGHPFNIAHVNYDLGYYHYIKGEYGDAVHALERAENIITEWGLTYLSPFINGFLGHAYALAGDVEKSLPVLNDALAAYRTIGLGLFRSLVTVYYGRALFLAGQPNDAFRTARQGLELARRRSERGHEAWALHLLGDIASSPGFGEVESAERYYRAALDIAHATGMQPLEAQCLEGLGRLLLDTGDNSAGNRHLEQAGALFARLGMATRIAESG